MSQLCVCANVPGVNISALLAAIAAGNNIQASEDILLLPWRTEFCDSKEYCDSKLT